MISIKNKIIGYNPSKLIILGSGLGAVAEALTDCKIIPYSEIDGFPDSTVTGHKGQLVVGRLNGVDILCMQGRVHLYEGYKVSIIDDIIKSFYDAGIRELIVTNAAGSLNVDMPAGSIMLINDHINFAGFNPLIGRNKDEYGPRFVDMSDAYNLELLTKVKSIAKKENIEVFEGVYLFVSGPTFETKAEIRAFKVLGADAVGMSTVPEVISAVHCGMKVLGISAITNLGTGLQSSPLSHQETLDVGSMASKKIVKLIKAYLNE
ncbi:MAG: purine-nucleoside phosphorylase [Alphaproteobacteria bacterium]